MVGAGLSETVGGGKKRDWVNPDWENAEHAVKF